MSVYDILDKLHELAEHIKTHHDEVKAGVLKLSPAAQQPAADILRVFVSNKNPTEIRDECAKIKAGVPKVVRDELNAHLNEIAKKIGLEPIIHDILDKLTTLAEHIKAHPDEAKAGVAKLSKDAQIPAGEILRTFVSDLSPAEKRLEILKIKSTLSPAVRAEIDSHRDEIAKKIGLEIVLSQQEILDKLHKLAEHIKAHPDEARAGVAKLSAAAQKPAGDIIKTFVSDKSPADIKAEITKIRAGLSAEVLAELDAHREEIAKKIGIHVPKHH